jgi:hypothetical protein
MMARTLVGVDPVQPFPLFVLILFHLQGALPMVVAPINGVAAS